MRVTEAIGHARTMPGVEQLELAVSSDAAPAVRLYEKVGFQRTSLLPGQIKVAGRYHDFITMWLPLQSQGED